MSLDYSLRANYPAPLRFGDNKEKVGQVLNLTYKLIDQHKHIRFRRYRLGRVYALVKLSQVRLQTLPYK